MSRESIMEELDQVESDLEITKRLVRLYGELNPTWLREQLEIDDDSQEWRDLWTAICESSELSLLCGDITRARIYVDQYRRHGEDSWTTCYGAQIVDGFLIYYPGNKTRMIVPLSQIAEMLEQMS